MSEMPSVTISRVRSAPRSSSGAVTRPSDGGDGCAQSEPKRRVGEAPARQNRRRIGAEAKERSMSERDNPGQPENEIER